LKLYAKSISIYDVDFLRTTGLDFNINVNFHNYFMNFAYRPTVDFLDSGVAG